MTSILPPGELEYLQEANNARGIAYGYARVSTAGQIDNDSIESQKRRIQDYYLIRLKPKGVQWGGFHVDPGVSAFKTNWHERPAGAELFNKLQPYDHVIVDRVDRMCRSARNMFDIVAYAKTHGLNFHFLDANIDPTSPMGEVVIGVISILSQLDSELKSKRMREVEIHRLRQGNRIVRGASQTIMSRAKGICGIRMVQGEDTVKYYLHWRHYAIAKLVCDNRQAREHARRSVMYLDAQREGVPFVISQFTDRRKLHLTIDSCDKLPKIWDKYLVPLFKVLPKAPFAPMPSQQDKEVLWCTGLLAQTGRVRKWNFNYQPHDCIYNYQLVDETKLYQAPNNRRNRGTT